MCWKYVIVSHDKDLESFENDGKAYGKAEYLYRKGDKDVRVYEVRGSVRNVLWENGARVPSEWDDVVWPEPEYMPLGAE